MIYTGTVKMILVELVEGGLITLNDKTPKECTNYLKKKGYKINDEG